MGFLAGFSGALQTANQGAKDLNHTLLDIELRKNEGLSKMYETIANDPTVHPSVRNEAVKRASTLTSLNPFDSKQRKIAKDLADTSSFWDIHTTSHLNDKQQENADNAAKHGITAPITPLGQQETPVSPMDAKPASSTATPTLQPPQAAQTQGGAGYDAPGPQNPVTTPTAAPTTAPQSTMTAAGTAPPTSTSGVPINNHGPLQIPELLKSMGIEAPERWISGRSNPDYPGYSAVKNKLVEDQAQTEMQLQLRQRMLAALGAAGGGATSAKPGSDLERSMLHQMQLSAALKESPPQPQQATVNGRMAIMYGGQIYDADTNNVMSGSMNRGQGKMVFADAGDGKGPRYMTVFSGDEAQPPTASGNQPPVLTKPSVTRTNTRNTSKDPFGFTSSSTNSSTTSYGGRGGSVPAIGGGTTMPVSGKGAITPPTTTPATSGVQPIDLTALQSSTDPRDQYGYGAVTNPANWHTVSPDVRKAMGPWFTQHGLPASGPRLDAKQEDNRNTAENGLKALDDISTIMQDNPLVGPLMGRWAEAMNKVGSSKLMTMFTTDPGTLDSPNVKALAEMAASLGDKNPSITAAATAQLITRMRALNLREVAALSGGSRGVATLYKSFESAMLQPSQDKTLIAGHVRGLAQEFANVIGTAEAARWGKAGAAPIDDETSHMLSKFGVSISHNGKGKLSDPKIISSYMTKAGGDASKAARLAKADGWDITK